MKHYLLLCLVLLLPLGVVGQGGTQPIQTSNYCKWCFCLKCKDKPKTVDLVFTKDGSLSSKLPSAIAAGSVLSVTLNSNEIKHKDTPMGKRFQNGIDYWNSLTVDVDPVTKALGFCTKTNAEGHIKTEFNGNFKNAVNAFPYELTSDGATQPPSVKATGTTTVLNYTITSTNTFLLKLTKDNEDLNYFEKRLRDTKSDYKGWDKYKARFETLYPAFIEYATKINAYNQKLTLLSSAKEQCKCGKFDVAALNITDTLCLLLNESAVIEREMQSLVTTVIKANENWLKAWMWYGGGKPLLNPFGIFPPDELAIQLDRELAAGEEVLALYRNLSQHDSNSSVKDLLDALKEPIADLVKELAELRSRKENLSKQATGYQDFLNDISATQTRMNKVLLHVSTPAVVNWMHHLDGKNSYQLLNSDGKTSIPAFISEKDGLRGLAHNLNKKQNVSANESVTATTLRTELDVKTDDFDKAFAQGIANSNGILGLLAKIKPLLLALTTKPFQQSDIQQPEQAVGFDKNRNAQSRSSSKKEWIKDVIDNTITPDFIVEFKLKERNNANVDQCLAGYRLSRIKTYLRSITEFNKLFDTLEDINPTKDELYEVLNELEKRYERQLNILTIYVSDVTNCLTEFHKTEALVNWLRAQTEPPIGDLVDAFTNFKVDKTTPTFRSEDLLTGDSQDAKGNTKIQYDILEEGKKKPVAKGEFTKYETVRWWPFVSLNYVFGSRAVAIYNDSTGNFKTNTDIDNFEIFAGAKWYLFRSNLTRTHARTKFIRQTLGDEYNRERGNRWRSQTYLFASLGVTHKFLRNYGFGAGWDLSPGFSIQGGANVFFRKQYELVNGKIKSELDIPDVRWFIGLAIDPNVVTKLIRLF